MAELSTPGRASTRRASAGLIAALAVFALLAILAIAAPVVAPYDPSAQPDIVGLRSAPPSMAHPFGTDQFSRDVLSRVLVGARVSLLVGLLATGVAVTLGTFYGLLSAYVGGRLDDVLMRLVDAFISIPRVLLVLGVVALWGNFSTTGLILLLGLTGWFQLSRLVRAEVLAVKELAYVDSARALGAHDFRIALRHVLPNVLSPVVVYATLGLAHVILLEAGLSYLGFGVQQPTPSWGNIIRDGAELMSSAWWISVFPGIAIVVTVLAANVVGERLRDSLDATEIPAR